MFKIGEVNKNNELSGSKGVAKKSNGDFSAYLRETSAASPRQEVESTSGISVTNAIFAAQMVDGEEERQIRKKLVKRGFNLIEKLEEIRDGLLEGRLSKDKLIETARMVKEHQAESSDPRLQEIMAEIELRVEVELAKLTS